MTWDDRLPMQGPGGTRAPGSSRRPRRRVGWGVALLIVVALVAGVIYAVVRSPASSPTSGPSAYYGTGGDFCRVPEGPALDGCNHDVRAPGGDAVMAVDRAPTGWNAGSRDAGGSTAEVETPLLPSAFTFLPSGKIAYNRDLLAAEPEVTGQDPVRVVYRIRDGAVWNDGTGRTYPVTAEDFIYAWRTFDGHDSRLTVATTAGYELISNVEASDAGKTVTVTFRAPYADWRGLFTRLEPYWFAAAAAGADPSDATRVTDTQLEKGFAALERMPRFSAGPFIIGRTGPGGAIVEVPNQRWYGATKPTLRSITFRPTAPRDILPTLQNQLVNMFTAEPDDHLVTALSNMPGINYQTTSGFTQEHLELNTTDPFLRDVSLRRAVLTAIDVADLIKRVFAESAPGVKRLSSHNLVPGEAGYQDVVGQVDPAAGGGDLAAAGKLLTGAGYTGVGVTDGLRAPDGRHVTIAFAHTDTPVRDDSAKLIAGYLTQLGITVTDKPTRDMPGTLAHRDFGIAELDSATGPLVGTTARRWSTGGPENFTGWSDPGSDTLLDQATREMDAAKQAALLNRQDRILTAAAVDLPLYRRPEMLVFTAQFTDIRADEAGGYATYNTQEWGLVKLGG